MRFDETRSSHLVQDKSYKIWWKIPPAPHVAWTNRTKLIASKSAIVTSKRSRIGAVCNNAYNIGKIVAILTNLATAKDLPLIDTEHHTRTVESVGIEWPNKVCLCKISIWIAGKIAGIAGRVVGHPSSRVEYRNSRCGCRKVVSFYVIASLRSDLLVQDLGRKPSQANRMIFVRCCVYVFLCAYDSNPESHSGWYNVWYSVHRFTFAEESLSPLVVKRTNL